MMSGFCAKWDWATTVGGTAQYSPQRVPSSCLAECKESKEGGRILTRVIGERLVKDLTSK